MSTMLKLLPRRQAILSQITLLQLAVYAHVVSAEDWSHKIGIGTALARISVEQDIPYHGEPKPSSHENPLDLLAQSAKGLWTINYLVSTLDVRENYSDTYHPFVNLPALDFSTTKYSVSHAEISGQYRFAESIRSKWHILFGLRYTELDWKRIVSVGKLT